MESSLYKGIVVEVESNAVAKVWIPNLHGTSTGGFFEYLGSNIGSFLKGLFLQKSKNTAVRCRIMTPLTSGAWFSYSPFLDASVQGNPKKINLSQILDYTKAHDAVVGKTTVTGNIQSKSNTPVFTLSAVSPILGEAGGIPIPSASNVPPGYFPQIKENQHVLVGFVNGSSMPIILGTLPTDKEWEATLGK